MKSRAAVLLSALVTACASPAPAPTNPAPAPSASAAASVELAPPVATAPVAPTPAANAADAGVAEPPAPKLIPICDAKCDKLVSKCSKSSVESCRLNCGKYDPPPQGCGPQVQAALECARDAKDLTCANVAPESCAAKFREIAACSSGTTTQAAAPAGLPAGWEEYTDSQNGFHVPMPQGGTSKSDTERTVTAPDGTTYEVTVMPLLKEKPSEKSLLHFMMKVQGRCSDKLKLDGFVEKSGRASIHYKSHCPDKTDWDGMIYVGSKNLVLLSVRAPTGKIGITEPFFYDFEFSGS